MRVLSLAKVAAEAEALRYRSMIGRKGSRAAMGAVAAVFAASVLVWLNVTGWLLLSPRFEPLYSTLILLGINVILTAIFGFLATRSGESRAEIDALHIRQKALEEMRGSLMFSAAVPVLRTLWRSQRKPLPARRLR
jgi:hypothetical protein